MRVVVSGGGTGGHISPILAVVSQLKTLDPTVDILYIGTNAGMEAKIVQSVGLRFAGIKAGKFRRYHGARLRHVITDLSTFALNIRDMGRVVAGFGDAVKVLRTYKPNVVFIRGGYVSVPVGLAARLLRIPYVIHESDTVIQQPLKH